jgi:hypothetical protein
LASSPKCPARASRVRRHANGLPILDEPCGFHGAADCRLGQRSAGTSPPAPRESNA